MSEALLYGILIVGHTLIFATTITTAFTGAHRLFKVIDQAPSNISSNVKNKNKEPDACNDIKFDQINFRYPTRPDVQILNGFNLDITEGKTVALVGPSGIIDSHITY